MYRFKVGQKEDRTYAYDPTEQAVFYKTPTTEWRFLCGSSDWHKFQGVMDWCVNINHAGKQEKFLV